MNCNVKSQVYQAEWIYADLLASPTDSIEYLGSTIARPTEIRFSELAHAQLYIDRLLSLPEVVDWYGQRELRVVVGRKTLSRRAYQRGTWIVLPQQESGAWAWRESVLLHEAAHGLNVFDGHGASWAGCFVHLTEAAMGETAAWMLSTLFDQHGITIERRVAA